MVRSETRARIGVAETLAGLHAWILPNALKIPKKHHDDKGLLPDFSSPHATGESLGLAYRMRSTKLLQVQTLNNSLISGQPSKLGNLKP